MSWIDSAASAVLALVAGHVAVKWLVGEVDLDGFQVLVLAALFWASWSLFAGRSLR